LMHCIFIDCFFTSYSNHLVFDFMRTRSNCVNFMAQMVESIRYCWRIENHCRPIL
jgi:hypothetical protein